MCRKLCWAAPLRALFSSCLICMDTFLPFICGNKNSLVFCLTKFVNFVNPVNKQVGPNLYAKKSLVTIVS
jgi:hypothetical protein